MRRRRPGHGRPQGPAAARAACSSSTPPRAASSTTTRSRPTLAAEHPYERVARRRASCTSTTCPTARTSTYSHESVLRRQQVFGYTHEELKLLVAPMATHRRRGHRLDGHRHADRRAVRAPAPAVRLLLRSCSPRSPTRRSTPSARSWSRRSASTIGPEGNLLDPAPAVVPPDRAAVPDHRQRRAGQAHPHQRRRRPARLRRPTRRPASTRSPAAARRCARRSTRVRRRGRARPSPTGPRILVLSDRDADRGVRADPVAAAHVGAVHHHLIREKTRTQGRPRASRRATPARCTTWRCSSATAPAPSTRTWRSSRSRT